jgi:hypothetical protein
VKVASVMEGVRKLMYNLNACPFQTRRKRKVELPCMYLLLIFQCDSLGLTEKEKKSRHNLREIDVCLDDICRMDVIGSFTGLRTLVLIN